MALAGGDVVRGNILPFAEMNCVFLIFPVGFERESILLLDRVLTKWKMAGERVESDRNCWVFSLPEFRCGLLIAFWVSPF